MSKKTTSIIRRSRVANRPDTDCKEESDCSQIYPQLQQVTTPSAQKLQQEYIQNISAKSNHAGDAMQKEIEQLMMDCELEDLDDLEEQITEAEKLIRKCKQRNKDFSDYQARLKDLLRIQQLHQPDSRGETREDLEDELARGLDRLACTEEQLNDELISIQKQLKYARKQQVKEEAEESKKLIERMIEIATKLGRGQPMPTPRKQAASIEKELESRVKPKSNTGRSQDSKGVLPGIQSKKESKVAVVMESIVKKKLEGVQEPQPKPQPKPQLQSKPQPQLHSKPQPQPPQKEKPVIKPNQTFYQSNKPKSKNESSDLDQFLVRCDNKQKYFLKGEIIKDIKIEFQKRGAVCFDEQFLEFTQPQLDRNLVLLDCDECKIHFKREIRKDVPVPVAIPISEIIKYIPVKGPESLHVSAISASNDEWIKAQPNKTIKELIRGATIREIRLAYTVNLNVEIRSVKGNRGVEYSIESNQNLLDLKLQFQEQCKFNAELQKWIINGEEREDNTLTFEGMGLEHSNYRVEVHEVFNIEYYGFAQIIPIKVEIFRDFFVEDDRLFLNDIESSSFPEQDYEFSFRISVLGYIFAAVKKHCRIQEAIQYIRELVLNSKKASKVWTPKTAKEKSYFNEHYALHNILHSGDDDLKIEFMRIYKGHSSLPMVSRDHNSRKQFYEHHFWVGIKSYAVTSLSVEGNVRGKSTFLNRIFGTDFEDASKRHPVCHNSVYIQYNVYRNDNLLLDLIDVSNDSIDEKEKIELCRASNLVIVHYLANTEKETRDWVKANCKGIPVVFVERDCHVMEDKAKFDSQLKANKLQKLELNYGVPELDEDNVRFHANNLNKICDQIHTFLRDGIQESKTGLQLWKFSEFLAKKSKDSKLVAFNDILRDIETKFSSIVDAELLLSTNNEESSKAEGEILSSILEKVVESIEHEHIDRAMSKLRESIRVLRSNRLSVFSSISQFEKKIEKQTDETLEATKGQAVAFFSKMRSIPKDQTTEQFRKLVAEFDNLQNAALNVEAVSKLVKSIRKEFSEEIKPREFSIENFWRVFAKLAAQKKQGSEALQRALQIYAREYVGGKTFEVINGETLEIPTDLLRSNLATFGDSKKIMVVGVFGPQSSGKSTLLNFLFGCDFLSSDGRCTSGIYGTYYDIKNRSIPNCNGVLILDTEGLFGNYENKKCKNRNNFDNKLVLFLLKVCDVLIMNTRGDVDVKCGNILELAFDSEFMEHKQGSHYPNMYMVLNQSVGNMNQTQWYEVSTLQTKVIEVAPEMKNFIGGSNANAMPFAFNISPPSNIKSSVLADIQTGAKIPTETFYKCTKALVTKIIEILIGRGVQSQGRSLSDIYNNMGSVWATITTIPLLTKHACRKLKLFENQIRQWKAVHDQKMAQLIATFKESFPKDLKDWKDWETSKEKEATKVVESFIENFSKTFPKNDDAERNTMIETAVPEIKVKLMSYFVQFRSEIIIRRSQMQLQQSKERGLDSICKVARDLRQDSFSKGYDLEQKTKDMAFEAAWKEYITGVKGKFDRKSLSAQMFLQIKEFYENALKDIRFKDDSPIRKEYNMEFDEYVKYVEDILKKEFADVNDLFSDNNSAPAICTTQTGPTDMTFKYLDLRKFFSFANKDEHYYLSSEGFRKLFDTKQLAVETIRQMTKDELVERFVGDLSRQLSQFEVDIGSIHEITARTIYYSKESGWPASGRSINNLYVDHELITHKQNTMPLLERFYKSNKTATPILANLRAQIHKQMRLPQMDWNPKFIIKFTVEGAIQHFVKNLSEKSVKGVYAKIYHRLNGEAQTHLEKIGIQGTVDLSRHQTDVKKVTPIRVKQFEDILNIVDSFPAFFNKTVIKDCIHAHATYGALQIAVAVTKNIIVDPRYKNEQTLTYFVNRQYKELIDGVKSTPFRTFIRDHINVQAIIEFVGSTVKSLEQNNDIKTSVRECILHLRNEIIVFDKDLQQISKKLSFMFKSELHNMCLHLLWKKYELRQQDYREKKFQQMSQEKEKQRINFMGLLDKDPRNNSESNAENFANKYVEFMLLLSTNAKRDYIERRSRNFLEQYTRERVQTELDDKMRACKNKQQAYDFLMKPEDYMHKIYNQFAEEECATLEKSYSSEIVKYFGEFEMKVKEVLASIKGSKEEWFSDDIFEKEANSKSPTLVANIFLEVFGCNRTISSDTPGYGLKKGNYVFRLPSCFGYKQNIDFFNNKKSQRVDIEIMHYPFFLQYLAAKLNDKLQKIHLDLRVNKGDLDSFRNKVKLVLCQAKCDCCKRLCDIDMRVSMHHNIHRCSYGHQMRAAGGVRVEKKEKGMVRHYASVERCEDIDPAGTFLFNGKEMTWQEFKESKRGEWDLNLSANKNDIKQNMVFKNLWVLAGPRICKEWQQRNGTEMLYVEYNEQAIKKLHETDNPDTHYVIAIDGSGSMDGKRWQELLCSLRSIFGELSKVPNNYVSVIVFNEQAGIKWHKRLPQQLNVETIDYPGGNTAFGPTFQLANQLLVKDIGKMDLRFVLISDGEAEYPEAQIDIMQQIQQYAVKTRTFKYVSIMIGKQSSDLMEQIRRALGGESSFVNSASEISAKFKEVLINK